MADLGEKRTGPFGRRRPASAIEPVLQEVEKWLYEDLEPQRQVLAWLQQGGLPRRTADRYVAVVMERMRRRYDACSAQRAADLAARCQQAAKEARADGKLAAAAQYMRLEAQISGALRPETQVNVAVMQPAVQAPGLDLTLVSQLSDEELAVLRKLAGKARGALQAAPEETIEGTLVEDEGGDE